MKWDEIPFGKVARAFIAGGTPSTKIRDYWSGDIPWVTGADFSAGSLQLGRRYISQEAVQNSATNVVPKGSLLIVTRTGVGKMAVAPVDIAISQDITGVVLSNVIDPSFALYALRCKAPLLLAVQRGATIKGITRSDLSSLRIPLPPLSEQRRIVEILDQADALRKKCAEADAKAARILPALFYKMFGDPATNPKGWRKGRVGDVVIETQYGTSVRAASVRDGVAVVRMNNIDVAGRLDLSELKYAVLPSAELTKYALRDGDVLFNRTNSKELVGKTGLWRGEVPAVAASYLIRVRVDEHVVRPAFLWAIMNTRFMKQLLLDKSRRAIGMANINAQELRALPIIIPPLDLQQAFELSLLQIERLATDYSAASLAMERLFSGLLHRAFTGDLTARWREAHMTELLAEMEAQARTLEAVR